MELHLQAIATLFSLVNPMVCVLIFSTLEKSSSRPAAMRDATAAMAIVGAVLVAGALLGAKILTLFGISLDAFSVAGGGVLIVIGLSLLGGQQAAKPGEDGLGGSGETGGLGKLILFAASPGTITGVMTIVAAHSKHAFPATALVAIAVVVGVTWLMLLVSTYANKATSKPSLARDMMSRYMGLIIVAMGIQFALEGYRSFMNG